MIIYTAESLHTLSDAAFNRVVAEAAGWWVDYSVPPYPGSTWKRFYLVSPTGEFVTGLFGNYHSEDAAWDDVPDYASSLDAAWGLATWVHVQLVRNDVWIVIVHDGISGGLFKIDTEQPARALSTAWLLWKQETSREH